MALKIIYILSDGRSGSTLLESILATAENTISVGEAYRFWERYYRNETVCGCGEPIGDCELWHKVAMDLKDISGYDEKAMQPAIKQLLKANKFDAIEGEVHDQLLGKIIGTFYHSIAKHSGVTCIIDSSKSPSWCKMLQASGDFDVRVIHLERSLPFVAESWKKKVKLPEYQKNDKYMPVKSNVNILRTWLRVKYLGRRFRKHNYFFLRYDDLCNSPVVAIKNISAFTNLEIPDNEKLFLKKNHGIAGNPMRLTNTNNRLVINPSGTRKPKLSWLPLILFSTIDKVSNILIK
jgi:hypothetical protein